LIVVATCNNIVPQFDIPIPAYSLRKVDTYYLHLAMTASGSSGTAADYLNSVDFRCEPRAMHRRVVEYYLVYLPHLVNTVNENFDRQEAVSEFDIDILQAFNQNSKRCSSSVGRTCNDM
jgi:hypothetical protein